MNKSGFVTINGKECYEVSVFDHGLLYGDGVYETIRVFNGRGFFLDEHIKRLFDSAKGIFLEIPYSKKELMKLIKLTYRKSRLKNSFIRIIITRGAGVQGLVSKSKPNVIIIVGQRAFCPLAKIKIITSKICRPSKRVIDPKIKSLNYLSTILARFEAKKKKFDDAVMLNDSGMITEATTSNLFIVKNNKIYTPSLNSGILEGVTRNAIIDNFSVVEKEISVSDLFSADEVFLSGTVNLVTSVAQIDNKKFKNFKWAKKVYEKLRILSKKENRL